jgi:two-component system OmpR family sensor kinase
LFWKFFVFIWLGQMAAVLGTGALFWVERQQFQERMANGEKLPPEVFGPAFRDRPPPPFERGEPHEYPRPPPPGGWPPGGPRLPLLPMLAGLLASLLCAAGLAWYIAKPIRHLRQAFDAAAKGDLEVRVSPSMGGRRDELADLGHDFDRMTEHLQVLMAGQKRLLHDVSHEMRSPLARLQAAIGLARQQPARMADSLQRIEREGERMNLLVGELLTLSRLEAGVTGALENVDMGELLAGIVEDARFEGAAQQIDIVYAPGEMAEIRANPELLHRAVENVVRNALRFSAAGGAIYIAAGRVDGEHFKISIGDDGPGVPDSQLENIFKPFFRGDAQNTAGGYGLGLAIAQRVIAAVNGKIQAKNKGSGGLLVEIDLPL